VTDPWSILESEVRELVRRRGIDPMRDSESGRRRGATAAAEYEERSARGLVPPLGDIDAAVKFVCDAVVGFGPLQSLLDDPEIEEVWINEPEKTR
jgi:pilus assembly protein CpaF